MYNKIILIGRLGSDAELKTTAGGMSVVNLSMATYSSRKVDDKWVETTEWHSVPCFGATAERVSKYRKGDIIFVDGMLHYNQYVNSDGIKMSKAEIRPDIIRLTTPPPPKPPEDKAW